MPVLKARQPTPACFYTRPKAMGVDPTSSVVVEDSQPGVEVCVAAGMFVSRGCSTERYVSAGRASRSFRILRV
jgi:beta-phosphoglucomutase-like phosphatase (HAD superfamily)